MKQWNCNFNQSLKTKKLLAMTMIFRLQHYLLFPRCSLLQTRFSIANTITIIIYGINTESKFQITLSSLSLFA